MQRLFAFSCRAILTTLAFAAVLSAVDACWRRHPSCRVSSPLALTALSPRGPLILGNDLTVQYRVAPGVQFTHIKLRVTNRAGELVYSSANLPVSDGEHQAVWPKGKWNQRPCRGRWGGAGANQVPTLIALVLRELSSSALKMADASPSGGVGGGGAFSLKLQ
jgi:hypothetical protein